VVAGDAEGSLAEGGGVPVARTTAEHQGAEHQGTEQAIERITVALVPKVAGDLQYLLAETGLSKTDLVNRAVSLYRFVQESTAAGREVIIRDKATGEDRIVMFF
jgi:hypothetical protein